MRRMILPLMLVCLGCQSPEPQVTTTGPDVEAITAWLADVDAAFSNGEYDGFLALFTDDALFMPPETPPVGVEDLRVRYQALSQESTTQMTSQAFDVLVSGDLAVVRAAYDETVTPSGEGETETRNGPWLIVLRKQPDGSWKGWHNMWTRVPAVSE